MSGSESRKAAEYHVEFDSATLRRQYRRAPWIANPVGVLMNLFGRIRAEDTEKIPAAGPAIIVPYHSSYLDPLVVGLVVWRTGRLPHYLAKSSLFSGVVGRALRGIGQIPVLRSSAQAGDSLRYAEEALAAGEIVVIYPQGTLTKDPEMWPESSKTGAARLALRTGVPLIPITHWGLHTPMPVGAKVPKPAPRTRIRVLVGDPIDYQDLADGRDGIARLTERITAHIALDVSRLRGEPMPERFQADLGPGAAV
ncbi:lysophospholipid acyltransferase family protein [Brevibacterium daeguense]|uniref:Lysophospholipid acyltransferase family protein n=1 Tax=Brevibacterium daeguense TaxID=909936 RepID=A0ABP8ELZ5_9MICO|nr:lysophospholipid acyltransferase family protein [Brevibacterium daeguense]